MVNVNDYQVEVPEGDMLQIIFDHQRDLMDKYHPIEEDVVGHHIPYNFHPTPSMKEFDPSKRPRWLYAGPLNIQDRASQLRFKDFAWRITEEITEATLALGEEDETHYLEELIDVLHFSVELLIMCGLFPLTSEVALAKAEAGTPSGDSFERAFAVSSVWVHPREGRNSVLTLRNHAYLVIEKLGEAMNRLKLKAWKVTAMVTDEKLFHQSLSEFFAALIDLLKASGFTAKTATQMYLNKNAVNQFRIGSKY
jgi:dimeric dUTPase (all-alpha-NTP-PPase superfamily)